MFRLFGLAAGDRSFIVLLLGQLIGFQRDLACLLHACKRAISTAFGHRQAGNTQGSNYKQGLIDFISLILRSLEAPVTSGDER